MAGTLVIDTLKSSASGTATTFKDSGNVEVGQLCKAWARFVASATPSVTASFNVSSITWNATGDYTVNFTNALADGNYSAISQAATSGGNRAVSFSQYNATAPTASACRFKYYDTLSGAVEVVAGYAYVAIFR